MRGVLGDELIELVKLAEITDELIAKLYASLGVITFVFEKRLIRGVQPVIAFVDDYIGKRKEAFAVSYYSGNNIRVIHESGIKFYVSFTGDPSAISLQELYGRLFNDPVVKDVVLKTSVNMFATLLRESLQKAREKINLERCISDLKYVIEEAKDPIILDKAKLMLAEVVIFMDAFSEIREEIDSLTEELEHVDAISQLESVIRSLERIVGELEAKKHLIDRVEPIVKKAKTLAEFIAKFADVIEEIKEEAKKQRRKEESEEEY